MHRMSGAIGKTPHLINLFSFYDAESESTLSSNESSSSRFGANSFFFWTHIFLACCYCALMILSIVGFIRHLVKMYRAYRERKQASDREHPFTRSLSTRRSSARRPHVCRFSSHFLFFTCTLSHRCCLFWQQSGMFAGWFHVFFILGCAGRLANLTYISIDQRPPTDVDVLPILFSYLPTFLFFSCYWIVLSSWIETFHTHRHDAALRDASTALLDDTRRSRSMRLLAIAMRTLNIFFLGTFLLCCVLYLVAQLEFRGMPHVFFGIKIALQIVCLPFLLSSMKHAALGLHVPVFFPIDQLTMVFYLLLAAGYLVYGSLILHSIRKQARMLQMRAMLNGVPSASMYSSGAIGSSSGSGLGSTRTVVTRIVVIAGTIFVTFTIRVTLLLLQFVCMVDISFMGWWTDCVYYFVAEIVPLFLIFVLLSTSPNKKAVPNNSSSGSGAFSAHGVRGYSSVAREDAPSSSSSSSVDSDAAHEKPLSLGNAHSYDASINSFVLFSHN